MDKEVSVPIENPRSNVRTRITSWLGSLRVGQKLLLMIGLFLVPVVVLSVIVINDRSQAINSTVREQRGLEYLKAVSPLIVSISQYRDGISAQLSGDSGLAQRRTELTEVIQQQLTALGEVDSRLGRELGVSEAYANLLSEWQNLEQSIVALRASEAVDSVSRVLNRNVLGLVRSVVSTSGLILEEQSEAYYLVAFAANDLSALIEAAGRLTAISVGVLVRKEITPEERARISSDVAVLREREEVTDRTLDFVALSSQGIAERLRAIDDEIDPALSNLYVLVFDQVLTSGAITYASTQFLQAGNAAVEGHFRLLNAALTELEQVLQVRVNSLAQNQFLLLGLVVAIVALVVLVAIAITRSITRPIEGMVQVVERVGLGDLSQEVEVQTRDELGVLAGSFNTSIVQLREFLSRQEEERQRGMRLQNNIGEFLSVAMDISSGDLTKRGRVTEDVLGNVVDAINLVIEEIAFLLKDVQNAADRVNQSAAQLSSTSAEILQNAQTQAAGATSAQSDVQNVSVSIAQLSQDALSAAQAASQTLEASQFGQAALTDTLSGMQSIRREVVNIAKGIKSLSDRSLEISEVVDTISSFASQTNLLALNAAIEAAGAGAAGSRFAVVAEEVRKLAEDSAKAAQRVSNLVKNIQGEVSGVVASVESGTNEVEQGYRIASQANERLKEIANLAQQSASFAQSMSSTAQQQVSQVQQVVNLVQDIANTAQQTETASAQGQQAAELLRRLSEQLSNSLSRFRLPA